MAIILISTLVSILNPAFFTLENLYDLLKSYSYLGILAVGVFIVILSGGIDISFTPIAQVIQYATIAIIAKYGGNMLLTFVLACAMGVIMGGINGLIIYYFKIPTIITTIATYNIYFGLLYVFSKGQLIITFPDFFLHFSKIQIFQIISSTGNKYGLSIVVIMWIVVIIISMFILKFTMLGRNIYWMGGNITAAKRVGINIFQTQMFIYCYMGFLAGIAAIVHFLLVLTVVPNSIIGKEFEVLAAVFLGGANIVGGEGTLLGTILGVILFAIMSNGLTLMRVSSYWYKVFIGLIILISVSISAYQIKTRKKETKVVT
jgi:simple sugar transport system permease protein